MLQWYLGGWNMYCMRCAAAIQCSRCSLRDTSACITSNVISARHIYCRGECWCCLERPFHHQPWRYSTTDYCQWFACGALCGRDFAPVEGVPIYRCPWRGNVIHAVAIQVAVCQNFYPYQSIHQCCMSDSNPSDFEGYAGMNRLRKLGVVGKSDLCCTLSCSDTLCFYWFYALGVDNHDGLFCVCMSL